MMRSKHISSLLRENPPLPHNEVSAMNIAVITGASSGMGKEFTTRLITENDARIGAPYDEIWIIARSEDKLISLQKALSPERIRVIPFDLTAPESLSSVSELLSKEKPDIRLLINCAGMGRNGAFEEQSVSDTHNAIALNCDALSSLTNICLPYMTGHKGPKGRSATVINIASSAGFLPQPDFAVYAATKSYVISFSHATAEELKDKGITVTCICPGPVDTDFIKVSKNDPNATFTGIKGKFVTSVDKLIPASLKAAKKGRTMYVHGFSQKLLHVASKILPTSWILFFEK